MRSRGLNPPLGLAVLRVVTGVIFVAHGAPKLFGGGVADLDAFLVSVGFPLPSFFAWVVTLLEFFGGLALVVGLLVTPIALLFVVEMFAGIVLVHADNGFYVLGGGQGGIEFNLLLIASMLALIFAGPGLAAVGGRRGESVVVHSEGDAHGKHGVHPEGGTREETGIEREEG